MRLRILLPAYLLAVLAACTQGPGNDQKAGEDEGTTLALQFYDQDVHWNRFAECRAIAEEMRSLGMESGNPDLEARGLLRLAYCEIRFGRWGKNWRGKLKACERICAKGGTREYAELLMFRGHMGKWRPKMLSEGVADLKAAIVIAAHIEDDVLLAEAHSRLAELVSIQGNDALCRSHALQALTISDHVGHRPVTVRALHRIATSFDYSDQLRLALPYAKRLLEIFPSSSLGNAIVARTSDPQKHAEFLLGKIAELEKPNLTLPKHNVVAQWYELLANTLMHADDVEGAVQAFRSASRHYKIAGNDVNYITSIIASYTSFVDRSLPVDDWGPFMEMVEMPSLDYLPSNLMGIVRVLEAIDQTALAAEWRGKIPAEMERRLRSEHERAAQAAAQNFELELVRRELVGEVNAEQAAARSNRTLFMGVIALLAFSFLGSHLLASRRALARLKDEVRSREAAQDRSEELVQQLLQTQKLDALGTLSAGIAHDFNNTLQAIIIFADIVKARMSADSEDHEHMEIIQKAASEGRDLTRGMLVFGGHHEATKSTCDLIELVNDTGSMVRHMLPASISIEAESPDDCTPAWVHVNNSQIKQVILNLALNARDAMPEGGQLSIAVSALEESADHFQLSVADNGVGMPKEVQARIFEPFFTTKDRGKGTGLGMSMVHGIIEDHGGNIEVDSKVGVGSTIRVCLPKAVAASEEVMNSAELAMPASGGRVLLTDDDDLTRSALAATLNRLGFQVQEAANGLEALDVYDEMPAAPDVILMDIDMPGLDGERCMEALRKKGATAPGIFMTGLCAQQLDDSVLAKPFTSDTLLEAIQNARGEREFRNP